MRTRPFGERCARWLKDAGARSTPLERDVSLRLRVNSFRQKIARNAAQIRMRVAGRPERADPAST